MSKPTFTDNPDNVPKPLMALMEKLRALMPGKFFVLIVEGDTDEYPIEMLSTLSPEDTGLALKDALQNNTVAAAMHKGNPGN